MPMFYLIYEKVLSSFVFSCVMSYSHATCNVKQCSVKRTNGITFKTSEFFAYTLMLDILKH